MTEQTTASQEQTIGPADGKSALNVGLEGMTVIDIDDDNALRFIQRVLESNASDKDRMDARNMIISIRTRIRKQSNA